MSSPTPTPDPTPDPAPAPASTVSATSPGADGGAGGEVESAASASVASVMHSEAGTLPGGHTAAGHIVAALRRDIEALASFADAVEARLCGPAHKAAEVVGGLDQAAEVVGGDAPGAGSDAVA